MARSNNSRVNEVLLAALACGASQEKAAQQAGVSRSTVQRRLADAAFRRQLDAFRADLVQRTAATLTAAGLEFVKTLVGLTGAGNPPATRLGAARTGLELGAKFRELTSLEERMAALEERVAEEQDTDNSRRRR
jgi:hypothetical protein